MMKPTRRDFLKNTASVAAGIGFTTILPSRVWSAPVAPSNQVNVALIGCRNMGFGILKHHLDTKMVHCIALCDVDENVLADRAREVKEKYGQTPELYGDFRKVLERKDIDAVIIGTPDHWHCLIMISAVQAGKDVYVEKPMANSIGECNLMVMAAKRYDRIVQVGQQQRSGKVFQDSMEIIKSGKLGTLRKVKIWANFNYGLGAIPKPDGPVPAGVNYDMWLGPAPLRPFNPNRFHGTWRHFWDYGGGLMSDWGVHLIDMGLWAGNIIQPPNRVFTYAANLSKTERQRETFDTMSVMYPKDKYVIEWDMSGGIETGPYGMPYGLAFVGENGTLVVNRNKYILYPELEGEKKAPKSEPLSFEGGKESHAEHVRNFLDCLKTRSTPACPPEVARAAALHVHIPNIAGRVGVPMLEWDDENSRFSNCTRANDLIMPEYRKPWKLPEIN